MGLTKGHIVLGLLIQFTLVFALVLASEALILAPIYQFVRPLLSQALGLDLTEKIHLGSLLLHLPFLLISLIMFQSMGFLFLIG